MNELKNDIGFYSNAQEYVEMQVIMYLMESELLC